MQIALLPDDASCIVSGMQTVADIIGLWPNAVALADELGVSVITVRSWKQRNSIPPVHWLSLVDRAASRGIEGVTLEALARIAAQSARSTAVAAE